MTREPRIAGGPARLAWPSAVAAALAFGLLLGSGSAALATEVPTAPALGADVESPDREPEDLTTVPVTEPQPEEPVDDDAALPQAPGPTDAPGQTDAPADERDTPLVAPPAEPITPPAPETHSPEAPQPIAVDNAVFRWGLNRESTGGAYFGGCNFLSAGIAGDAGNSRIWKREDGFYRPSEGAVRVERPTADGAAVTVPTWDERCLSPGGATVNGKTTNAPDSSTQTVVRIEDGVGEIDPERNTAEIAWSGSFTVAYYGGMTYWSATDPKLVVAANGTGTVTATLSGFGAEMDNPDVWSVLPARVVTLATLSGVRVTDAGFTVSPDYLGVSVDAAGRNPQADRTTQNASWWGSFPQDFNDYHLLTGQSSYWYTTDGGANSIQPRKVADPIALTFEDADQSPPEVSLPEQLSASDWMPTTILPRVSGGTRDRSFHWERKAPGGPWQQLPAQSDAPLGIMPLLADSGSEYRVRVESRYGVAQSGSVRLSVAKKTPGSIVPRTGPELSERTQLNTVGDITARIADGSVRDLSARATGVAQPLTASAARTITIPWSGTAETPEAWLYPGQRYLGQWQVDRKAGTASITLRPGQASSGTDLLGGLLDGQEYSLLLFTHTDPVSHVAFRAAGGSGAGTGELTDAGLRWGINVEASGGAYFGGCNFLSAGRAGDAGSARVWTKADGFLASSSDGGRVRIEKPDRAGKWGPITWENKCLDPFGNAVTSTSTESTSGAELVLSGGTGTVDPARNSASIRWTGTFTVSFYGGMTYWSASNPELTVKDGVGTLTATGSGFGADMDDSSVWSELTPQKITLATFKNVTVRGNEFVIAPDYLGVSVGNQPGGRNEQPAQNAKNRAFWGSFPRDFIGFQILTGQSSYWYTSDGARDRAKLPLPIRICADQANCAGSTAVPVEPEIPKISQNALIAPPRAPLAPRQATPVQAAIAPVTQAKAPPTAGAGQGDTVITTVVTTRRMLGAGPDGAAALPLMLGLLAGLGLVTVVTAAGGGLISRGVITL